VGQTTNEQDALAQLRRGEVDLVVIYPARAYENIVNGSQAVLQVYHNEIDPTQIAYVSELNRRILLIFAAGAKEQGARAKSDLQEARAIAESARAAAESGNSERSDEELQRAGSLADRAAALLGAAALVMGGMEQGLGVAPARPAGEEAPVPATVDESEAELQSLEEQLARFEKVPADVMVSPLATETKSVATFTPSFVTFYAPGVLALILQHVAVSIASLALVREKLYGAMELFRVAPVTAFEILFGKYGSYLVFVGFLALVLTAAMIFLLGVPLLGQVAWLVVSVGLLIFASLGIGFAISATSGTDSQAVQVSMLVLLASMFFSGFVFPLQSILVPVRYVGYLLPVTYSITNFQNVMLKGIPPPTIYVIALVIMGIVLFVFSWWRYRRSIVRA
jgi:ABC-2 type transport system permease protein